MIKKAFFLALILGGLISCRKENSNNEENLNKTFKEETAFYKEKYRPQFHFSPKEKWMNDPNGLVYNDGVYHLFYQHYPDSTVWGPMHWGHAVSKDLIFWEHKPIALFPDELGYIFSGSAVVDKNNTTGFGTKENPPLVAMFTYHKMEKERAGDTDYQSQGIAYSLDNGDTWEKYEGNPVIPNNGMKDFRDPKVFWNDITGKWTVLLVGGDHLLIYESDNLKNWKQVSEFGKNQGAHGGVWECPDLFKLTVEGSDEEKWVLFISINPGGPNGGSATQYFVGDFDGKTFISDQKEKRWVDTGADNYAGVTYNNEPNAERIFIGWMNNWNYGQKTPTVTWRSAMTLPRKLTLHKIDGNYYLKSYPVDEIEKIIEKGKTDEYVGITEKVFHHENFNSSEIKFNTAGKNFELIFGNEKDSLSVVLNNKSIVVDRSKSGLVNFDSSFADKVHTANIEALPDTQFEVRVILDAASVEMFLNKGQVIMTEQIFPTKPYHTLKIRSVDGQKLNLHDFQINKIKSVWE
ncbi:glycoside hydrolase family 32 protein [Abyssalbus ytuae]|uniref:Glycoside hydrolase family 32 protein n=1 Tax=Abyssalbus ytuae TaxID=2926907 RepID=A0A9E6ZVX0_9FLAO|nr:glycoside hydrolase family 32 protein [Abyssalbus ytuae]UOB18748.1 glycoside hydrolase family 32 protein [Abyssalbus ytuae]